MVKDPEPEVPNYQYSDFANGFEHLDVSVQLVKEYFADYMMGNFTATHIKLMGWKEALDFFGTTASDFKKKRLQRQNVTR